MNPLLYVDFYKPHHQDMYPDGMTKLYSNFTPRKSRIKSIDKVVVFGIQHFILEYLIKNFNREFFGKTNEFNREVFKKGIIEQYKKHVPIDTTRIEALWDLGYLPIEIKALEEGTLCPIGVPMLTITNTHSDFGWLVNYLETLISCMLWQSVTSATIAYEYKKILNKYALETTGSIEDVQWQGHDFSMRGMSSVESAILSGMGHLTSFTGTDTIPAIYQLEQSYNAKGLIGASVPATEHSVECTNAQGTMEGEYEHTLRLLKLYPSGIVSKVSDTTDLWSYITQVLPKCKSEIMNRDGKLVIRPDCYSEDTLILTPDGWKEFNKLTPESLVAQVNEDNSYSFVKPLKIVNEEYNGEMYHYKDFHGKMDLIVTPNHRMVYKQFDKWKVDFAEDCKPNNYTKSFIRSAKAENKYQSLTNSERLCIAFQADGSKCTDTEKRIRFNFSKNRKIQRLKSLLNEMNLSFKEYNLGDGRIEINIEYSLEYVSKNFDWVVTSNLCSNWCQEFIEELSHWDSSIRDEGRIKFDTTNFSVSNIVELIALSAGYGCLTTKYEDDRKEIFSDMYTSHILIDNKLGGQSITVEKVNYNGRIVCVTVPTGKIIVKRNRCTMICGNSGDPVDIICGTYQDDIISTPSQKGVIELLWDIFGGTTNAQGYKVLDSHIGAIYGDSITTERATQICERLKAKGFASTNIVLGVGLTKWPFYTEMYN